MGLEQIMLAIARDIQALRPDYPQLEAFSVEENFYPDRLLIEYDFRTHPPRHRGGWTSGVPNPDDDGVWFYLDLHDPASTAQIHTQPEVPELRLRDKRVMLLLLDGAATRPLGGAIHAILERHGVRPAGSAQ